LAPAGGLSVLGSTKRSEIADLRIDNMMSYPGTGSMIVPACIFKTVGSRALLLSSQKLPRREKKFEMDHGGADDDVNRMAMDEVCDQIYYMNINLGPGYDDDSLIELDRKLADWFLEEKQEDISRNPTKQEINHYERSIVLRTQVLGRAASKVIPAELSNESERFEHLYLDLYKDMETYRYAWLGILLKKQEELGRARMTLRVLKNLACVQLKKEAISDGTKTLDLYGEALALFVRTVLAAEDEEYYDHVGENKFEHCELQFIAAQLHATIGNKSKAVEYFSEALSTEIMWKYEERNCARLLEMAIGRRLSEDELFEVSVFDDDFLWKCLSAVSSGDRSACVDWKSQQIASCDNCGKQETKDINLLQCARCKTVKYCNRECQKHDWKDHKVDCKRDESQRKM
jgi:tetratricopeptide (TPR) repeat protein